MQKRRCSRSRDFRVKATSEKFFSDSVVLVDSFHPFESIGMNQVMIGIGIPKQPQTIPSNDGHLNDEYGMGE